jgi:tartrate dehydratase beta subunit/fumarate hydratase class I family protein
LGTEAIRRLEVVDFPAVMAYDAVGGSVYDDVKAKVRA